MERLNADLYHANLIVNYNCLCGYFNENAEHYLLHCNRFTVSRIIMLFEINKLSLNSTWKVRILVNRQTIKRYMYIVTITLIIINVCCH
jgi:hypothetical protein